MQIWKRLLCPYNMEAIWAVTLLRATWGKLYPRLSTKKGGLILWVLMPKNTLGSSFTEITL